MANNGIEIYIPGYSSLNVQLICSDYTGTLSYVGQLIEGVRERFDKLASEGVQIHVVTSDTRKTASRELADMPITLQSEIPSDRHDEYKLQYLKGLGVHLKNVAVFGNGKNDKLWLEAVRDAGGLAIAVDVGEGCAVETLMSATVFVTGIANALDLLIDKKRIIGTLRTEADKM